MKMELWVRSQDKRILQKVDNIFLDANYENKRISTYDGNCSTELGTYKTKKRAIEVLDEINKLLIPKPIISTYNVEQAELLNGTVFIKPMLDDIKIESYTSYVYQMPEN